MLSRSLAALTLATLAVAPATARADSAGKTGRITKLEIVSKGSTDAAKYRGSIQVRRGKDRPEVYHWGGGYCTGKDLTDGQIDLLMHALERNGRIKITPRFRNGQAGKRCLVGFTLHRVSPNKKKSGGDHD